MHMHYNYFDLPAINPIYSVYKGFNSDNNYNENKVLLIRKYDKIDSTAIKNTGRIVN